MKRREYGKMIKQERKGRTHVLPICISTVDEQADNQQKAQTQPTDHTKREQLVQLHEYNHDEEKKEKRAEDNGSEADNVQR